jgi:hypothetical protein
MPQGVKTNIIIHKRNNAGIVVAMNLADFIKIMKEIKRGER